jgi:hypothetical protein
MRCLSKFGVKWFREVVKIWAKLGVKTVSNFCQNSYRNGSSNIHGRHCWSASGGTVVVRQVVVPVCVVSGTAGQARPRRKLEKEHVRADAWRCAARAREQRRVAEVGVDLGRARCKDGALLAALLARGTVELQGRA